MTTIQEALRKEYLDKLDKLRLQIIDVKGVSLEEAIVLSGEMPFIAMYVAFRRRAKLVMGEKEGLEELARIREVLVERTFQVLRRRDLSNCDYHYVVWPGRKDMMGIYQEAVRRFEEYVQVIGAGVKHSVLPRDVMEIILRDWSK